MEFLRKYLLQTRNHLQGLTLSQRLAVGSCAALIVVSLLWLVQWGSKPELVPLLSQSLADAELTPIQKRLDTLGIEYKVSGDMILVPAEKRARLLAQLSESESLPKDISTGFEKLIAENNVWASQEEQGRRWTIALGNELSKVLREFEGVEDARVFIDRNTRRTVTGPPVTPTASVFVKLAPGLVLDKQRTFAMASLVSRSIGGLDITRVAVTDARTGRSLTPPSAEDALDFGNDLVDRQQKEEYFASKIRGMLANIPGLLVAVHAELDPESRRETRNTWSKPLQVSDKTKTLVQQRSAPAGGPGVVPNTSKAIGAAPAGDHIEDTTSEGEFAIKPQSTVTIESVRNGIKSLAASVNVPRSYLAAIFKSANGGKEPTDAELKAGSQDELKKIAALVRNAVAAKDDLDAVVVEWFHDEAMVQMGGVVEAGSGGEIMALVRLYGGKAGMGGLAALSLLMMLMMVRKVSEGPVLPGEEPPKPIIRIITKRGGQKEARQEEEEVVGPAEPLTVNAPPVGEAEAHEDLLVGHEVDESTLRVQQVVQQVSEMIKEDPKTSAGILERWIEAEKQ